MGQTSVDTSALLDAGQSLAAAARLAHDARATAHVAASGEGWAVDGALPTAVRRYASTLDTELGRLVEDSRQAAALLALAASRYAQAERAATAPAGVPGASRDVPGGPRG